VEALMEPAPLLPSRRRWLRLLPLALAPWAVLANAQGVPAAPRDTLVKAAFLHKFASFVEWPDGTFARPDAPLRIGILGDELLWRDLGELARDRDRDGRPVVVVRLAPGEPVVGLHIVYFKASSPARVADLLATLPRGVLSVSDSDGAHPRGSVLSFFLDEGRVRFGVSTDAATRQGLRLNPRLIAAARQMQGVADFLDGLA
jgi:hypothetical protein